MSTKYLALVLALSTISIRSSVTSLDELKNDQALCDARSNLLHAYQALVDRNQEIAASAVCTEYAAMNMCNFIKESYINREQKKALLLALVGTSISCLLELVSNDPSVLVDRSINQYCQTNAGQSAAATWTQVKKCTKEHLAAMAEKYQNPSSPLQKQSYEDISRLLDETEHLVKTFVAVAGNLKVSSLVPKEQFCQRYQTVMPGAAVGIAVLRKINTCITDGTLESNQELVKEHITHFDALVATNAPLSTLNREALLSMALVLQPIGKIIERVTPEIPDARIQSGLSKLGIVSDSMVTIVSDDTWFNQLPKETTENLQQLSQELGKKIGALIAQEA